jgi:3-hydroxyisobutyrate dehydrogenase
MTKVAFIGLGVMGYPMAGHLKNGGHDVTVYNRTGAKADKWVAEYGGQAAPSPREAAAGAEIAFTMVGNDEDVRAVTFGEDGALAGLEAGQILVDHTTASAIVAREIFGLAKDKGVGFIDAPVSGGQAGAENGVLTVMCGGEPGPFDTAKPVIDCYARACTLMGAAGSGQLTKMVNQICIAGLVQGLAEGMNFGIKAGLDMDLVIDVISKGAAQSWQMDNRASNMCAGKFDYGFAVDWMRKDMSISIAEARLNGARLPVAALVDQFYAQVQARGGNRWDTSSLMHLLAND